MTDKSDDKVGHLNTILAIGGGNLNDPIFKSSNARGLPGGGMLKFRVDRRITVNSLYCGHPRDRELVSLITRVRNSGIYFSQTSVIYQFAGELAAVRYSEVSAR